MKKLSAILLTAVFLSGCLFIPTFRSNENTTPMPVITQSADASAITSETASPGVSPALLQSETPSNGQSPTPETDIVKLPVTEESETPAPTNEAAETPTAQTSAATTATATAAPSPSPTPTPRPTATPATPARTPTPTPSKTATPSNTPQLGFNTYTLEGNAITSDIFADYDLTMINVWATWCGPCIAEMPELGELYGKLPDNVNLIGIVGDTYDDDSAIDTALQIASETGATYTNIIPDDEIRYGLFQAIQYYPTTLFVDSEGYLVGEFVIGAPSGDVVEGYLEAINNRLSELGL